MTGASSQKITQNNVMDLLELSFSYGIGPLKEECGDFLFENSKENLNVAYLLGWCLVLLFLLLTVEQKLPRNTRLIVWRPSVLDI